MDCSQTLLTPIFASRPAGAESRLFTTCRWGLGLISLAWFMLVGPAVQGDVVWIRGEASPVYGRITLQSDAELQVRVFEEGRYSNLRTIPQGRVELALINLDTERLAELNPQKLGPYRDYAEELAAQKQDPSAQHLARRLFLIAAAHSSGELRRSSLLGLIAISTSDAQRKRLKMLQFLTDSDVRLKSSDQEIEPPAAMVSTADQELMLRLVRSIRQGTTEAARTILENPENRDAIEHWNEIIPTRELVRLTQVIEPDKTQLRKLLTIELQIMRATLPSRSETTRKPTWGDFATQTSTHRGMLPDFDNVTSFSPRESVYRNGFWVEPR